MYRSGTVALLLLRNKNLFLIGDGFSADGQFPFLDELKIGTFKKKRIYESTLEGEKESLRDFNPDDNKLFVRIESPNEYPNYFFRSLDGELNQITYFANPFKSIQNVHKEVIKYKREDGLDLSSTLYLPDGYNFSQKEKLPLIMWAYPREYKDKSSASQTTKNPNQKISKGSKTTYELYATKIGIKHVAKKDMPLEWLNECCKVDEKPNVVKFFV